MRYGVIAADPPWRFQTWGTVAATAKSRSINNHYQTMSLDDIKALPVADYAAKDCALFLCVIDTHLPEALQVISDWGFKFKTVAFCWAKTNKNGSFFMGLGWWSRSCTELCLLATRGHPKPLARDVRRLVVSPRREHSRKPDEIYEDMIPRLAAGPYLELFARTQRDGWDVAMSNEAEKYSHTPTISD